MEPENRSYVDADTGPGDAGTEKWADTGGGHGEPAGREPLADPAATTDNGVVKGSPADAFIDDPEAITARNDKR